MYGGDDDPCPFDDANHGVSATRRRSYRGGDGQYVEYNSDEYRDQQFSKDEDDRDLAAICTPCAPVPASPVTGEGPPCVNAWAFGLGPVKRVLYRPRACLGRGYTHQYVCRRHY